MPNQQHNQKAYQKGNTVEFAYINTSGGLQKSADIRKLPM